MTTTQNFLAFDLGAESGRAILGGFDGERLALQDIHRFPNTPARLPSGQHWDILRLWNEIKQGIGLANQQTNGHLAGMGLDTWGVDFGLLDRSGALIGNPYHYRDRRTDGMMEEAFRRVPRAEIYGRTGIQFMFFNSLYQLLSMVIAKAPALESAQTFLTVPDLINYWLTGRKACEFTNTTTTQCYDPRQQDWAWSMLEQMGIPTHIFPEVVQPGTVLGELLPGMRDDIGVQRSIPVIAPACHDTGSAVAAVPAGGRNFAWISSGTWSIVGAEVDAAVINEASLGYNLTNEGGVNGTYRLSSNVGGLWLVQECRRAWLRQGEEHSYAELAQMAAAAPALRSIIDPDHASFAKPNEDGGDMAGRIRAFCRATGQPEPSSKGEVIRCALESLALKYRRIIENVESVLGYALDPIHMMGGGTQNTLQCQFTADATNRPVIAGPVEATTIGNLIMQMKALGAISSLQEGRAVVRRSFDVKTYQPATGRAQWDEAYGKLNSIIELQAQL